MQPTLIHQAVPPQELALVVKDRHLPFTGRLTMGRGTSNDLCLNDPRSSRYHAVIESTPGGWAVRDLNSANGTWLNGNRISGAKLLKAGDSLVVGDTEMQIVASA
jgi:pSer/pThr/pTyr-binding forkhead associated (FHA) protein